MKKNRILIILICCMALIVTVYFGLPAMLTRMGLHPADSGGKVAVAGQKALIITTSHGLLGDTGEKTGVYASEMTVPYYAFLDAGMAVDIASIRGGKIPIEPISLKWPLATPADKRFRKDAGFKGKTVNSLKIDHVDFTGYDIVYMAGGWGAAYDLGMSDVLGKKISEAYAAGVILGSVCHGALGFLKAKDLTGNPLVAGRRMTAVTDKQVKELDITMTPLHPERELRAAGALFESKTAYRDTFANHVVVDGSIVTGQNQNAGASVAHKMMELAEKRKRHQTERKD